MTTPRSVWSTSLCIPVNELLYLWRLEDRGQGPLPYLLSVPSSAGIRPAEELIIRLTERDVERELVLRY